MKRILLAISGNGGKPVITPPAQPENGPGGKDYRHASIQKQFFGEGKNSYWIFSPGNPLPKKAPVVVFLHGWQCITPNNYGKWIEHLVRRGNIVIFPTYQWHLLEWPSSFTSNTLAALSSAYRLLREQWPYRAELEKLAFVGHSMGGVLSVNVAAVSAEKGLPQPRAIMCLQPGLTTGIVGRSLLQMSDLQKISGDTWLLSLYGEDDHITGKADAVKIYRETGNIPSKRKNLIMVQSDTHGFPPLVADHLFPLNFEKDFVRAKDFTKSKQRELSFKRTLLQKFLRSDALSFFGSWKLFDALCSAAFYGEDKEFAMGDTPEQRFMGRWSDGVPVKELRVVTFDKSE